MKRKDHAKDGGGRSLSRPASAPKEIDRTTGKNFLAGKNGLKTRHFKIAHPNDQQAYVDQCGFVICWFTEMFKRVGSDDEKLLGEARGALQTLLIRGVHELLGIAWNDKNSSSGRWATKLLAAIANEAALCEPNEVYRQEKTTLRKLFRKDVSFPKSPLYQAIHRELWFCQWYRRELISPMAQRYLSKLSVKSPKVYLPLMKLPKLSPKTWRQWEKPLWGLVKKNNPDLLEKLRAGAARKEASWSFPNGKSKMNLQSRRLYWKDFQKQFQNHLKAIACQCGNS